MIRVFATVSGSVGVARVLGSGDPAPTSLPQPVATVMNNAAAPIVNFDLLNCRFILHSRILLVVSALFPPAHGMGRSSLHHRKRAWLEQFSGNQYLNENEFVQTKHYT
jgi:hypothetical protein